MTKIFDRQKTPFLDKCRQQRFHFLSAVSILSFLRQDGGYDGIDISNHYSLISESAKCFKCQKKGLQTMKFRQATALKNACIFAILKYIVFQEQILIRLEYIL